MSGDEWTHDAAAAIALCTRWAGQVMSEFPCEIYLFGSAIYEGGDQFDAQKSDLDLVALFHEDLDATTRAERLAQLRARKHDLELQMIPVLRRTTCDEPGVSIVAVQPLEIEANLHKSHARSFFDRNLFYDLRKQELHLKLPQAGVSSLPEDVRHALEFVQGIRNAFLSVSANNTGGLEPFDGPDPIPKALARTAAQLVPDSVAGAWYDTRFGLEYLYEEATRRKSESDALRKLHRKLSIRRGGRGIREALTDHDQLLLAEILFDKAAAIPREPIEIWEVRFSGGPSTLAESDRLVAGLRSLLPDARVLGISPGSIIVRLMSSLRSYNLFERLNELNVLPTFFDVAEVEVARVSLDDGKGGFAQDGLLDRLAAGLADFRPTVLFSGPIYEENLVSQIAMWLKHADHSVSVRREVRLVSAGRAYHPDLMVEQHSDQPIIIEVSRVRNRGDLIRRIDTIRHFGVPTILVLYGAKRRLQAVESAIKGEAAEESNIRIVTIDTGLANADEE